MTAILRCTVRLLLNHFESLITMHEPNNSAVQQSLFALIPELSCQDYQTDQRALADSQSLS